MESETRVNCFGAMCRLFFVREQLGDERFPVAKTRVCNGSEVMGDDSVTNSKLPIFTQNSSTHSRKLLNFCPTSTLAKNSFAALFVQRTL